MELWFFIAGLIFIPLIVAFVFKKQNKESFVKYLIQILLFEVYPFIVFYFVDYWDGVPKEAVRCGTGQFALTIVFCIASLTFSNFLLFLYSKAYKI